ncbi:TAXI family TRAP transporter solute-binding subunit [Geoalkalibacter halelectricus]|uniref:TAXI family TRAP transporter solute-binding subunit n=1 Tax=Geoalkalibacter halelectricus TaxID=2847045 RepID=A0ABY5ZQI5_9BACT|nr:TAXI family TRAP transporter solute-binding subunit [Geoalkalibacter halelectricus]MDO3377645.1 TAXI family TRAP transporter solute-binding subunit [Geoalkalibacter halelectricus]UWZ81435.1 TAXI family TRAP transporter solute-binding subunit [Geoalkalibacter halelectricus]
MKRFVVAVLSLLLLAGCQSDRGAAPEGTQETTRPGAMRFVTIGTGGVTGVYYPVGGAISRLINERRNEFNLRTTVESTGGSVFNINALMSGDLELGVVQSDLQHQAYHGQGEWAGRPQTKLRSMFALHPEAVTILSAADSNIESVADLVGKIVNIGAPGTGQRVNALDLFDAAGIDPNADLRAEGIRPAESASMLQDGRIDAFFYTVGHPNGSVKEAVAGTRRVRFVPVDADLVEILVNRQPFYAPATIPIEPYPGVVNTEPVPTFGVKATICTSSDVPEDVVYTLTRVVFENLESLRNLHPALEVLTPQNMLEGLSAPLHAGAERYFREKGML